MSLRRRSLCVYGVGWGLAHQVSAQHVPIDDLLQPYVGKQRVFKGRVQLDMARLADNGFNVPLKVSVESPMTPQDYVSRLLLLSNRNPRPLIAAFAFGPASDRVAIATRVRLGGSQTVYALAQMSDGAWWLDTAEVEVTESACLDQT